MKYAVETTAVPFVVGDIVISIYDKRQPEYVKIDAVEFSASQSGVVYRASTLNGKPISNGAWLDHAWFVPFPDWYGIKQEQEDK